MFLRPDWACARARRWCYTDVLSCWPAGTLNVPPASAHDVANPTARLMLVAVSLAWGLSWPAMKIALNEIPPFSMRVGTPGLATIALFALALMQGRTVSVKSSVARAHLMVAGCLNIACFTLFAAFAQLATATSRVAILTYTMPIWAALLAYPVLGERFNLSRGISLLLAIVGLAFAYLLWFEIVRRLPATTASLGVLSVPVVGILSSVLILGERPTVTDIVGSAFILAAAAGVLLAPNARSSQTAPIEQ